jgi:hypothetical protein
MPTAKICAKRHKAGSQDYKDCIAYKKPKGKAKVKPKARMGY